MAKVTYLCLKIASSYMNILMHKIQDAKNETGPNIFAYKTICETQK